MAKIIGLRKAVSEYQHVPYGFHAEIWGEQDENGDVRVWTSDYLSQNSWTINHPETEHKLDGDMREYMDREGISMTAALRKAVAETWNRCPDAGHPKPFIHQRHTYNEVTDMGIYGEIQDMRAEDESRTRRQAERMTGAKRFAVDAIVHECRDREPADSDAYDEGFHDGCMACLKDMCEAAGISWADVMDEAMAAMGLYRCPERIGA